MKNVNRTAVAMTALAVAFAALAVTATAQTPALQQKIAAVKAAMAKNQQQLAHYTWQEEQTVSVRGDVKSTALYQVHLGSDGKPVKVDISQSQASKGRRFGVRHHVEQNYEDYAKAIGALAQSYAPSDPSRLQQLSAQGNVAFRPGGSAGVDTIVLSNDVKPGDVVSIAIDRSTKAIQSVAITTYLTSPSDGVGMTLTYGTLPDGTNHVATTTIVGESKSLTIVLNNHDYQKLPAP